MPNIAALITVAAVRKDTGVEIAKAFFAQIHRHLYFFDLPGRQKSKQYPRSANKSTEKTGILLGLTFCGLYALKQRQSGSSVGCRSPPYQSFLKPTKND